jgi:hypothetical protein
VCGFLAGAALAACSRPSTDAVAFDTTLSTQEVMAHVINPAAVAAWDRAGTVENAEGITDLAPDTEEEWLLAENEASTVAEGGNLLLLPDRVRKLTDDDHDWITFARNLTTQALALRTATTDRDKDKMFETGGKLYEACVACHEKYLIPFLGEDGTTIAPKRND